MPLKPDTVAALSSGLIPSGVAVIRVSGPRARGVLAALAGRLPLPRVATLRTLQDPRNGSVLDKALVLFLPGPASFTGEDVAEFHCHGGRAVVGDVLAAIWSLDGVGPAQAGDFTRQAFLNGKLDLVQVEALGDLIHASTRGQREQALGQLGGLASRRLLDWMERIADARALIEADLDFSDEEDVPGSVVDSLPQQLTDVLEALRGDLADRRAERMRDGFRVVLAGATNSGKSTLLNALIERDAALVSPIAGTTRDLIDVPIDLDGLPVILTDTAGLRDIGADGDAVEALGMARARVALDEADCVLWLEGGDQADASGSAVTELPRNPAWAEKTIRVRSKSDLAESYPAMSDFAKPDTDLDVRPGAPTVERTPSTKPGALLVSGVTGDGLAALRRAIIAYLTRLFDVDGPPDRGAATVGLDARRRSAVERTAVHVQAALERLGEGPQSLDQAAEELRLAQQELGTITGNVDAESLLDRIFARFCIGK